MPAARTSCGACTSGSTGHRGDATRPGNGSAAATSTTSTSLRSKPVEPATSVKRNVTECFDELLHDVPNALVAERAHGRLLTLLGQAFVDGFPGALEGAVHRRDRGLERLRDLLGGETEHLAQNQDGVLSRRQVLE